ncbi:autophagy- protein 2 [Purpureocillium takamizusanense]|uniref:Autophagy-related protein 2 n=1 Tax=Purpureocillium takamizusanense TaxID=2060973 RepID=A0A9Q8QLA1_9HYPO|nr:autophagy- protein 2 [Purpureocillium takamizusanense]UNI20881.1 autophagy- protein 2 [Purpureocillium takamizusanense]
MATLFQSFRSSSMPKRLLRYALAKLDFLDTDALDTENLDLAIGRNTVFEFRDVGIRLKKLEKTLQLPATFGLKRAKVLLLRITVPVDFYSSPITIQVDGIDVTLELITKLTTAPAAATSDLAADPVPNTVDLAQSFLDTQPSSERKQLEDALAAETLDLGASVSVSDDGSEDDAGFGTGQALSLPTFLADFLHGVVDRTQVTIRNVNFQVDMDVPADVNASSVEPVSFQISIQDIDVEGVTTSAPELDGSISSPTAFVPKEGKRHISLDSVRAFLISEANVFPSMTRSPSMASPSAASSPIQTRNPPSRQTTSLSQGSFQEQPMATLQESFREHFSDREESPEPEFPLGDSEEALGIPYDLDGNLNDEPEDDSPPTPRASLFQEATPGTDDSVFHSMFDAGTQPRSSTVLPFHHDEDLLTFDASTPALDQEPEAQLHTDSSQVDMLTGIRPSDADRVSGTNTTADLTESHLYTHDEAESMYLSAFSNAEAQEPTRSRTPTSTPGRTQIDVDASWPTPQMAPSTMPGTWNDDSEGSQLSEPGLRALPQRPKTPSESVVNDSESEGSSPAFSRHFTAPIEADAAISGDTPDAYQQEDAATPKGPTRVAKEILHVKRISFHVPSHHQHIQVQANSPESVAQLSRPLGSSVLPQAPGGFSTYGATPASPNSPPAQPSTTQNHNSVDVTLGPMSINFDASVAFVLAMLVDKLLKVLRDGPPAASPNVQKGDSAPKTAPAIKVKAQEISLNFVNRLGGVAETSERYLDPAVFHLFEQEVLLNMTLQNLAVNMSPSYAMSTDTSTTSVDPKKAAITTEVELEKFRFGYTNGDIVSFDSGRPMSTSVRDTFRSSGKDISIRITKSAGSTRTDIETLPLVIQIDLQRLDETFGWFGGLSSFLNMSASMTSSPSPTIKSTALPAPPKQRGVHFETPIDPEDRSVAAQNKANVRIGGALVELVGRDCSLAAETHAIKIVSRDEGIGIACSRIRVSGPYLRNSLSDPAITGDISGLRLEFLMAPKDKDLEKLLELIIPSKDKFDDSSDEIMVDTLLRQRRKGSVLRATLETVNVRIKNLAQLSPALPNLGEEIAKLSTVAKYLPEDDRPGLLTLGSLHTLTFGVDVGSPLGYIGSEMRGLDIGHITFPSLFAVALEGLSVRRNQSEDLISSPVFDSPEDPLKNRPVLMARVIGDEIEPTFKLKLHGLRMEYWVPTMMDFLGLGKDATPQDFEASLAASVASLNDHAHAKLVRQPVSPPPEQVKQVKALTLDIGMRDCLLGLNPLNLTSKMAVVFTDAHLRTTLPRDGKTTATMSINKASVLLTDDVSNGADRSATANSKRRMSSAVSPRVAELSARGFVDICYISSASIVAVVKPKSDDDDDKQIEVVLRDDLLVLETCADSTQTLITLANALKPPTPPSRENKFRTKVVPVQDLLASISAEAFGRPEGEYDFDQDFAGAQEMAGSVSDLDYGTEDSLGIDSQFYGEEAEGEELFDATKTPSMLHDTSMEETAEGVLLTGFEPSQGATSEQDSDDLVIHDDFYRRDESIQDHTAKVWNSTRNTYDRAPTSLVQNSPLKVSVRDVHVIWNLFDGYDWAHTRDIISKAVEDVETKAIERQARLAGPQVYEEEIEDEEAIGDFLFNSIYIGIPANRDPRDLTRAINEGLNDNATETESVATTAFTTTTGRTAKRHQPRSKRLKLHRSKHHKITFELQGVNVDMVMFPPNTEDETLSSIDVRVQALDIFDHVPTSTWKKFATYDQDQGEREMGTSMVHLELLNVKPLPELAASEIVLRATVLPLRLHVDQDALDFITRFFEFKDENVPVHSSPSDVPFLQRAEVNDIPVKLDFKPKRVDYAGLRSGHTTEFMNFIVLEESRMVLRHVIIYGVSGFDRLGKTLNDIWMPDVRKNQLPGVVAGLAPVRSLVNIGSGFRDLVEIPLREYQKDGRVIRSISKGAAAFARTTGTELVKLGAKIAVGTQYALQGAEDMLTEKRQPEAVESGWDDEDLDPEDKKQISLYADQPTGVLQGIRGGYRSLTRDVNLARDAIIAVPGEVMESQSASGVARAVWKRAPTIIFRPAVGVTKAIGQTLMGATNTIDPQNKRRIGEKYKH